MWNISSSDRLKDAKYYEYPENDGTLKVVITFTTVTVQDLTKELPPTTSDEPNTATSQLFNVEVRANITNC